MFGTNIKDIPDAFRDPVVQMEGLIGTIQGLTGEAGQLADVIETFNRYQVCCSNACPDTCQ
jgi:hypothetical protein